MRGGCGENAGRIGEDAGRIGEEAGRTGEDAGRTGEDARKMGRMRGGPGRMRGVQSGCRSQSGQMQQQKQAHDEQALHSTFRPSCQPGRNSRQVKRFGSPFQAACWRLTLSVPSLCVRKDRSLLGGPAGFKSVLTLKTPIGRSFQLLSQNNCRRSRCWLRKKISPRMPKLCALPTSLPVAITT